MMKDNTILRSAFFLPLLLALFACGKQGSDIPESDIVQTSTYEAIGDSTVYGLACDGCNDSILVFLPDTGGDPVRLHIIDAMRHRSVFGHPEVGDRMAVLLSPDDSTVVKVAIDMEQLRGTWVYQQMPSVRQRSDEGVQTVDARERLRLDSLIVALTVPREYGYLIKRDGTMMPVGGPPRTTALDEESPVEYPPLKWYSEWHIHNGKVVLTSGGMRVKGSGDTASMKNDTAEFVLLSRDTMAISLDGVVRGFHLKADSADVAK